MIVKSYEETVCQIKEMETILRTNSRDTTAFMQASRAYNALLFHDMTLREFHFIAKNLGRDITAEDEAKLVVAAALHEDLSEVLPIDVDAQLAFKFKNLRQQQKMTQQQVANITGNYTQSQIAKAEAVDLPLTLTRWSELFRAIGKQVTVQIG